MVLANDLAEVPRLAARVDEFGQSRNIPARIVSRFNVALEEAVTNTISYAFPDVGRHAIEVRIEFRGGQLSASITDDGQPFDPLSQPAPDTRAGIADRKVGGLGIHLLRSLMQSVGYRRIGGRNVLTFRTPAVP